MAAPTTELGHTDFPRLCEHVLHDYPASDLLLSDTFQHAGAQVDLAYLPFAERFDVGAKEFCDFDMRAARGGAIGSWLDAMHRQPYSAAGASPSADPELLAAAMKKHRSLDFFDYDSYGAAKLHPHAR